MKFRVLHIFAFLLFAALPALEAKTADSDATLVVFNSRDPASADLAKYYAAKRKIPAEHVVGIDCPVTEEITREEYDEQIAGPLRKIMTDQGFWKAHVTIAGQTEVDENTIRFVALMRGMPLKIARTAKAYAGDKHDGPAVFTDKNEASVDSELSCLGCYSRVISGALINPYYSKFAAFSEANLPQIMLVCRLDGPTPEIVRGLIDDTLEAERTGVWGFAYIDTRNIKDGGLAEGDKWLNAIAADMTKHGVPVIQDNGPDVFPAEYPIRNVAFYYAWYTENAYGVFADPNFRFNKGAVACHIHSFSAQTVRDPDKFWAGPLLAHGAVAVLGNVYEPFLLLTPNLDIFQDRLENGYTFAESAYMSQRGLSWMTTFLGDPLYRPFQLIDNNFESLPRPQAEFAAYRSGAMTWLKDGRPAGERKLQKLGRDLRSGIIFEGLAALQAGEGDFPAALESFEQARKFYKSDDDAIRVAIREMSILRATGKNREAHNLVADALKGNQVSPAAGLLRKLNAEIDATPTPAAAATGTPSATPPPTPTPRVQGLPPPPRTRTGP